MMWKNVVERDKPQMTIWRMRIACWTPKAVDTHSEYVIIIAFPLKQWFRERASVLLYTYIACLVSAWDCVTWSSALSSASLSLPYFTYLYTARHLIMPTPKQRGIVFV